jgi:hypothetical protein
MTGSDLQARTAWLLNGAGDFCTPLQRHSKGEDSIDSIEDVNELYTISHAGELAEIQHTEL